MYLTSDENFQYFCYNDKAYKTGTVVELDEKYINTHLFNGKMFWKYAQFSNRIESNGMSKYFFWAHDAPKNNIKCEYCYFFTIPSKDMKNAIKEIVRPIEIELVQKVKKKDTESQEVIIGWAIYVFSLMFSFIFNQWYLIWIFGSIYFFAWRNIKLWE